MHACVHHGYMHTHTYTFFIGSTDTYHAHAGMPNGIMRAVGLGSALYPVLTYGEWDGELEPVALYSLDLASDAHAQRIAFLWATLSGNACVLVVRQATPADDTRAMSSTMRHRVTVTTSHEGNRTLLGSWPGAQGDPVGMLTEGYVYVPDVKGSGVAWLVGADNTVSPVGV